MKTNIISIKFEDKFVPRTFSGRAYSYYTDIDVEVGNIVIAPTQYGESIARVSEINIPEFKVEQIKPYLKLITDKIDKEKYLQTDEVLREVA